MDRTCTIDGCDKPQQARGLCPMHYQRQRLRGDAGSPSPERRKNIGACTVEGCDSPSRKIGMCASHYGQWRRTGVAKAFGFKWSERQPCLVCGSPWAEGGFRRFCSGACRQLWYRHGRAVPDAPICALCGSLIVATGANRKYRKRADSKLCSRCKAQSRTEATPGELALRDGPFCQLCGCDVDLTATRPDPMRPSVDHITPRAHGGGDESSNNQLAHLLCNQVKSDRYSGGVAS